MVFTPLLIYLSSASSSSIKRLQNSADAQSALDLVISQIGSNDINMSIQALAQVGVNRIGNLYSFKASQMVFHFNRIAVVNLFYTDKSNSCVNVCVIIPDQKYCFAISSNYNSHYKLIKIDCKD